MLISVADNMSGGEANFPAHLGHSKSEPVIRQQKQSFVVATPEELVKRLGGNRPINRVWCSSL